MWKTAGIIGLAALFLGGCSRAIAPGGMAPGSTVTLNNICPGPVFAAAETAVSQNYRIASIDSERGIIKTIPQLYEGTDSGVKLSDIIVPTKQTFRRTVTVQVRGYGEQSSTVSVRADIERQDTMAMESMAYQRQGDDRPDAQYTNRAIYDQDKREVWTFVRRDYQTEQQILTVIRLMVLKKSASTMSEVSETPKGCVTPKAEAVTEPCLKPTTSPAVK
jgi:hypothetical protein